MRITYQDRETEAPEGLSAEACLRLFGVDTAEVLAARSGTETISLTQPLFQDTVIEPLTYQDEEGRRIYERSLRFVMLMAVRRRWPGQRVRVEYSVGRGVLVRLPGRQMDEAEVRALEDTMRDYCAQNLPFVKKRWKLSDALRYFAEDGQADKVALLRLRKKDYFDMYTCAGMWEYFYGVMAPTTGCVSRFGLSLLDDGFVMRWPEPDRPDTVSSFRDSPKLLKVFRQSADWSAILGINNVADLEAMIRQKELRGIIRVNEALHEQAISDVAREIVAAGKQVILVAGPSSSGKTTFAGRLAVHLRVLGCRARRISLDDYYLDRDTLPREPDGSIDLEHLRTLDLQLISEQIGALLEGREVLLPKYSFLTGRREPQGELFRLAPGEAVILEGIHALNPELLRGVNAALVHRVFVSALTCLNLDDHNRIRTTDARLLRRIVRDHQFRGTTPAKTLAMWPSVRRGEERWFFPFQEQADSMFNTALVYELPVLAHFAYPLLMSLPKDSSGYHQGAMLRKILNYVPDITPELLGEIPPLSLLREFIGGCTIDEV